MTKRSKPGSSTMHGTVTWAAPPDVPQADGGKAVLDKLAEAEAAVTRGDTRAGIPVAEEALQLARDTGRKDLAAEALLKLGMLRRLSAAYTESARLLIEAVQMFSVLGMEARRAETMLQLGQAPMELGDYETALSLFKGALIIALAQDSMFLRARTYRSVGLLMSRLKDFAEAERLHRRALDHFIAIDDRSMIASALNSVALTTLQVLDETPGATERERDRVMAAIDDLKRACDIAHQIGNHRLEAQTLGNIGNAYGMIGDRAQNVAYERNALAVFRTLGARRDECISWSNIGRALLESGETDEAIETLRESLALALENGLKVEARGAHRLLAQAYAAAGDDAAARHAAEAERLDGVIDEDGARLKLTELARAVLVAEVRSAIGPEAGVKLVTTGEPDEESESDLDTGLFTRAYMERWYRSFAARATEGPRAIAIVLVAAQNATGSVKDRWRRIARDIERDLRVDAFGIAVSPFVLLVALPEFTAGETAQAEALIGKQLRRALPDFTHSGASLWLGVADGDSTDSLASLIRRARDGAAKVV